MDQKLCQSCAMPMSNENLFGTNEDGTKNEDYCSYCFKDGKFTSNTTMGEMIEICVPHMVKQGFEESNARGMLNKLLPNLKRWAK
ncbi:zinc ribbon domain-containing protein [Wukongibacter baidiensis]|uniref:zinc ribbon domain-containing protein n=1 Tax=Wukongibacter baidiensis TaxID=1723361 RepID=UPI003D7F2525